MRGYRIADPLFKDPSQSIRGTRRRAHMSCNLGVSFITLPSDLPSDPQLPQYTLLASTTIAEGLNCPVASVMSDRSSIVVTVGKMAARMTSWRRTAGEHAGHRCDLQVSPIGAVGKALPSSSRIRMNRVFVAIASPRAVCLASGGTMI